MKEFKTTTCECHKCRDMCRRTPCQGTPEEMKAVMDAGLGHKLMLQYRENHKVGLDRVDYLAPAVTGYEGERTPWWPAGRCTFFDSRERCELHEPGLKPLEGRVAIHEDQEREEDTDWPLEEGVDLRDHIARLWQNPEAQALVAQWKKEHMNVGA